MACEPGLRLRTAPRLVGHAAQDDARLPDPAALDVERRGDRDHRKGVGSAVANLEVEGVPRERRPGQLDRRDELSVLQVVVPLRRIARQAVKLSDRNGALPPARAPDSHHGVERVERVRHVARVHGDALLAPPEDRVHSVEPFPRAAAGSGLPFVARHRRVVEVRTSRALHQVAAVGRHVAELRGGARDDGLTEQRVLLADQRMVGRVGVLRERADGDAAVHLPDRGEIETRQVDQLGRVFDVLLHQVEEVRPSGQESRVRVRRGRFHGGGRIRCARVSKRPHRNPPGLEPAPPARRTARYAPRVFRSGPPVWPRRSPGRRRSGRCCRSCARGSRLP
jgi:hypothetical protein